MRLELENIGKLSKANIELNGITVIAGENNTGKSTVGKALYSIFNGSYDIQNRINKERINSISRILRNAINSHSFKRYSNLFINKFSEKIVKICNNSCDFNSINNLISDFFDEEKIDTLDNEEKSNLVNKISNILKISDEQLKKALLNSSFNSEFNIGINNIYNNNKSCVVSLTVKNNSIVVSFVDDEIEDYKCDFSLNTEALYIDDPYILDDLNSPRFIPADLRISHREKTIHKLMLGKNSVDVVSEILIDNKLDEIYSVIDSVCNGEMIKDEYKWSFRINGTSKSIDIKNISTGMKTFVILKKLLQSGEIVEKSTIILDEPEIHLHPEWQLVFAEIIVLLQKEFDMTILINTHSPYFLEAIEVYSAKHNTENKCKYYLAENTGNVSIINDVTDNIEFIYKKLAMPFQKLENERFSDD